MHDKNQIWAELYEADRLMRYYHRVFNKYSGYHAWITYLTVAFLLSASVTLIISNVPNFVAGGLFLVSGALVLTTIFWDFSAKATSAKLAAVACSHLSQELQALWLNKESKLDLAIVRGMRMSIANSTDMNVDKKINKQTADESHEYLTVLGETWQTAT